MDYNFYVSNITDIDVQRIGDEAPPQVEAIIVQGPRNSLLMLRESFLAKFQVPDTLSVLYGYLGKLWGFEGIRSYPHDTDLALWYFNGWDTSFRKIPGEATTKLVGWRVMPFDSANRKGVEADLAKAVEFLQARQEIRVSYLLPSKGVK